MKKEIVSLLLLSLVVSTGPARAGDVIANFPSKLTPDEIREMYLGDKTTLGAVKLILTDNAAAQAEFLAKVVRVDADKYLAIWARKNSREGLNPPVVRGSDPEVISTVKSTPGAVGYVNRAPTGVTVIMKY